MYNTKIQLWTTLNVSKLVLIFRLLLHWNMPTRNLADQQQCANTSCFIYPEIINDIYIGRNSIHISCIIITGIYSGRVFPDALIINTNFVTHE